MRPEPVKGRRADGRARRVYAQRTPEEARKARERFFGISEETKERVINKKLQRGWVQIRDRTPEEQRRRIRAEMTERMSYGLTIPEWKARKEEIRSMPEGEKAKLTIYASIRRRGQKRSSTSTAIAEHGKPALQAIAKHGDRAADAIVKADDPYAADIINRYGRPAVEAILKQGPAALETYKAQAMYAPPPYVKPFTGGSENVSQRVARVRGQMAMAATRNFAFARHQSVAAQIQQQNQDRRGVIPLRKRMAA